MNPNKCPLSTPKTPVTTVVYRTIQDVIDHVIIPALKDADLNPDHYDITAFVNDWVVLVDSTALNGYFVTAPNIPGIIDEYATATKAKDLREGDRILVRGVYREVITKTPVWKRNGIIVVTLILSTDDIDSWPEAEAETVPAGSLFRTMG